MTETPLARKLGIKEGTRFAIVNEPEDLDLASLLEPLPDAARSFARASVPLDVIVFFAESVRHLRRRFSVLARFLGPAGGLWVAYPKRSSPKASDLSFDEVQAVGLGEGLVDNKSCAINEDWAAVRFVRRLHDRQPRL